MVGFKFKKGLCSSQWTNIFNPKKGSMISIQKRIKYIFLGIISLSAIWLGSNTASNLLIYFKSGLEYAPNHEGFQCQKAELPIIKWQESSHGNEYIKNQISEDYVQALKWINACYRNKDVRGLENYLDTPFDQKIKASILESEGKFNRSYISHELVLKHLSSDYSVAIIEDINAEFIEQRIVQNKIVNNLTGKVKMKVFLILKEGTWKIVNWIIDPIVEAIEVDTHNYIKLSKNLDLIESIKGINYYPKDYPWLEFWGNFQDSIIREDFRKIKDLGLNCVRIFLPVEKVGQDKIQTSLISKLDTLLAIANEYELKIIPTLFDFPLGFEIRNYPIYYRQLDFLIKRYKSNEEIIAWNIKNEPDLDFKNHGKGPVLMWLEFIIDRIKKIDRTHPITIGWSNAKHTHLLSDKVDFISCHFYKNPDSLPSDLKLIKALKKPFVIEEFGKSSFSTYWNLYTNNDIKQREYFRKTLEHLNTHNAPYMIWTLYDFENAPSSVFGWNPKLRASQKKYGLIDSEGNLKPAGLYISQKLNQNNTL
jgi:hypothetical protein